MSNLKEAWPPLPLEAWAETYATLHMWTQIIGKIVLQKTPLVNHWWNVAFSVSARGLASPPIPYGNGIVQFTFDFQGHVLHIETSEGKKRLIALEPCSVADFYEAVMQAVRGLGLEVAIWTKPVEVAERIPFERDEKHAAYNQEYATRFWQILVQVDRILKFFRARFIGKASPVHFFWGAFDLATTRFSGRLAPPHPGTPNVGRHVMAESYSQEVSSCGFWPGAGLGRPAFYAYAYPEPAGFENYTVRPAPAYYDKQLHEFLLPYDEVRAADEPEATLLAFLQSTYEAAAILGKWDRELLERR
jgi:hypothetical protein